MCVCIQQGVCFHDAVGSYTCILHLYCKVFGFCFYDCHLGAFYLLQCHLSFSLFSSISQMVVYTMGEGKAPCPIWFIFLSFPPSQSKPDDFDRGTKGVLYFRFEYCYEERILFSYLLQSWVKWWKWTTGICPMLLEFQKKLNKIKRTHLFMYACFVGYWSIAIVCFKVKLVFFSGSPLYPDYDSWVELTLCMHHFSSLTICDLIFWSFFFFFLHQFI